MLTEVEQVRIGLSKHTKTERKSLLGQYLTPAKTAEFMAGLFGRVAKDQCQLLDPGAGIGSLTAAFLERIQNHELNFRKTVVTAFEIDKLLVGELRKTLSSFMSENEYQFELIQEDFIAKGLDILQFLPTQRYTHVILNPPYKKIATQSLYRSLLRQAGIETVNFYTGFVALALALLQPQGELVAIIPRSFCNGPYYRSFREFVLERASVEHIHLFHSREKAFKDDGVLQENVIIKLLRNGRQEKVTVSTSSGDDFEDLEVNSYPFEQIVLPRDPEKFIHIPTSPGKPGMEVLPAIASSLTDLGIAVSTGPVVTFRVAEHLRQSPGEGTAPLLYPGHFVDRKVRWPNSNGKKPNAIAINPETEKWLYPVGYYCVARRFTSKEERRRLVASIVEPGDFDAVSFLGFENHLNVFHFDKQGLDRLTAYGMAVFLNSTLVDDHFMRFSGHTQVNATDLRMLRYPSREVLVHLGQWAVAQQGLTQEMIDREIDLIAK
jgi:adenine-specific DNA-methyltransferase